MTVGALSNLVVGHMSTDIACKSFDLCDSPRNADERLFLAKNLKQTSHFHGFALVRAIFIISLPFEFVFALELHSSSDSESEIIMGSGAGTSGSGS